MKNGILLAMAVVLLFLGCTGSPEMSPEQREAVRQSNETFRRMQTPYPGGLGFAPDPRKLSKERPIPALRTHSASPSSACRSSRTSSLSDFIAGKSPERMDLALSTQEAA